jgi:hypothetical protein
MQRHFTREIDATTDAQLTSATDAVAAAIQFVRSVAEEHAANRTKSPLELRLGAEKKAEAVDDAIISVEENSAAEYVRQIARGEGPAERQQFSLGNQHTWSPGRALPQFLLQGRPILLTDPEQVTRWDRLAKQEARENTPGLMAQLFNAQHMPAPPGIAAELEEAAEGKIVFQSADRPGWDKVIYYHAGEKRAAERLADILRNNRELTEQQRAEVWRLEGWPEADVARELARMRNVQRMHDESWWTPPPSLAERAQRYTKNLLGFGRSKGTRVTARAPAKAGREQAQRLLGEIQRSPEPIARLPQSTPLNGGIQRSPERVARLPRSAPLVVEPPKQAEHTASFADASLPESVPDAPTIAGFHQTDARTAAYPDIDRTRTNGNARISTGLSHQDEPIYRWLEAAMEDVHRHAQSQRRTLNGKRPSVL